MGVILAGGSNGGAQSALPTQEPAPTIVPLVSSPAPTVTPFVAPPPPATPPAAPPTGSDLQAPVAYANTMHPLLVKAIVLVERDGDILREAEEGNDAVLCDGRLGDDNDSMQNVLRGVGAITPPADAGVIHDMVLQRGDAWTEALDNIDHFCETGNELYKIPAMLKLYEAGASLQDAANHFWLLLVAKGVEDWVQR